MVGSQPVPCPAFLLLLPWVWAMFAAMSGRRVVGGACVQAVQVVAG